MQGILLKDATDSMYHVLMLHGFPDQVERCTPYCFLWYLQGGQRRADG